MYNNERVMWKLREFSQKSTFINYIFDGLKKLNDFQK